jgi:CheY-like chemotaxis protein
MLGNHRLLVVEDDIDGAAVIDWMLKSQQAKTTVVSTAEAAIEQLKSDPSAYSVVIIDLALPEMDGFQLLMHIKKQALRHLPTIAMTAYHTPELRQKALSAGFDAYVPKPLDKAVLLKALDQVLDSRNSMV